MKRLSAYLLAIVAGAATALCVPVALHRSDVVDGDVNNQINAAFRDGLFFARLDVENETKPRLLSRRWSTDADRRLFVAAYLQGYREMRGDPAYQMESTQPAAKKGHRDGLADGLQQHDVSGSFRPTSTENYRRADRAYSDSRRDLNRYMQSYREAYCNG